MEICMTLISQLLNLVLQEKPNNCMAYIEASTSTDAIFCTRRNIEAVIQVFVFIKMFWWVIFRSIFFRWVKVRNFGDKRDKLVNTEDTISLCNNLNAFVGFMEINEVAVEEISFYFDLDPHHFSTYPELMAPIGFSKLQKANPIYVVRSFCQCSWICKFFTIQWDYGLTHS